MMNRLHTVLAATDFSAPSRHAAQRAALLARALGARLELVHVLERDALSDLRGLVGADGEALQERVRSLSRESLAQLVAGLGGSGGNGSGQHLLEGPVPESIVAQADLLDASLLVVGSRGVGFMRQWLLGSTAERLLRRCQRPVLVIKQAPRETYRSVLVAVDGSPAAALAIQLARAVVPQARLTLLHAYELPFEGKMRFARVEETMIRRYRDAAHRQALATVERMAREADIDSAACERVVVLGDAASRILEQEEEQGAELIVLGRHGTGRVEDLLLGGVTQHVLAQARCDVLIAGATGMR